MPYSAEISRTNPSCFLFLIDQSSSMGGAFGGESGKKKAQGVSDALNRLLQNVIIKCAKAEGVRDYFHVGVIGYASEARPALAGPLAGQPLVPMSDLAANPLRVEQRTRKVEDDSGGTMEQTFKFPVWVEPVAQGKTAMCQALNLAREYLSVFIARYPDSYPPLAINISDGRATDGNPEQPAAALRALATSDGEVLLFNIHLSSSPAEAVEFPGCEDRLSHPYARLLFRMSSPLPLPLIQAAENEGYLLEDEPRGFVFNADLVSVIRFLDIGTRVARQVR
jgi:hypothetical protein